MWGKNGEVFDFPSTEMRDEYLKIGQSLWLAGFENTADRFNFILNNGVRTENKNTDHCLKCNRVTVTPDPKKTLM